MNQTISTILIPLLLVSQSLFSVPHSHEGTSVNEPEGHAAKAHVHWSWANHDADSESSPASDDEHEHDHDSDAIYGGDTQFLNDARAGKIAQHELSVDCFVYDAVCIVEVTTANSILRSRQPAPETLRPKCARYLQLLSIRC